ncbi:hypothetical protein V8G54_031483 [Vigna mungo]|uniref:Uncharacterized protein n=1 Tax=Vigna mungo TaxID=3915 RepID=A0AAQ3RHY9_VIGMU
MFLKVTLNSSVKESPFIICYIISNVYIETEIYITCRKEKRKGKTMTWFCYVMNLPKLNLTLLREKENGEKIKLEKESTCRITEQAWFGLRDVARALLLQQDLATNDEKME